MPAIQKRLEIWFDYPNDPMGGRVLVRHLKEGEINRILQGCTDTRLVYDQDSRKAETVVSRKNQIEELIIASVADWEKFYDGKPKKGNPHGAFLPCTDANIRKFCIEDGFSSFVSDCREKLAEMARKDRIDAEKN